MDQVLRGMEFCYVYIDDLLASSTPEEHKKHLHLVFQRFEQFGIIINPTKCLLGVSELHFLGHHVTQQGGSPFPEQVKVIRGFPLPTTLRQLQEFFGLVNFLPQIYSSLCHHSFPTECAIEVHGNQQPFSTMDYYSYLCF